MKKLLTLAIVLVLTLVSVTPAAARGEAVQLYGVITAINPDALTFTMLVVTPERYEDDTIIVQVTDATKLKDCEEGTSERISFEDLTEGLDVRVTGAFVGNVFVATKIIQYVPVE